MSRGYSVAQTARLVCGLRWACGRLSEILGAWAQEAATAGAPHGVASVRLAVLSWRLAAHRETLDGLQPDSHLMSPWREAAPADPALAAALDTIAATEGPSERLAVAVEVFVPRLSGVYEQIGENAAPHCDAALAAAARSLRHDLDRETAAAGTGQPGAAEAVEVADRMLSAAGGVVGPSLLRPEDWAWSVRG